MVLTAAHAVRDRSNEQAYAHGCIKVSMHMWNHTVDQISCQSQLRGVTPERRSGRERSSAWEMCFLWGNKWLLIYNSSVALELV